MEKHQDINLLRRMDQVLLEMLNAAGWKLPARIDPGRRAEVLL